jgi:hypothetical protein
MRILDGEGRLFGRINIIDALALLMIVAVATAGAALVGSAAATTGVLALGTAGLAGLWVAGPPSTSNEPDEKGDQPRRFALVDAGTHPRAVVKELRVETLTAEGDATVRELVETPALDGTHLFVRLEADDTRPPYGTTVAFEAPEARFAGTVVEHVDDSALTRTVAVALRTDAPPSVIDAVDAEGVEHVGDSTEVRATVEAVAAGGQLYYGGTMLRPGARVTLGGAAAVLTGTATEVNREPSRIRAGPADSIVRQTASAAPSVDDD